MVAGKAAGSMVAALSSSPGLRLRTVFAVGTHKPDDLPAGVEWCESGHPFPDARSMVAGARALEIARHVPRDECLLILLSGGASALLTAPAQGITLGDKRRTIEVMMHGGADIQALNTVRKHLSRIKGGHLALACGGATVTLAVSDVIGDDLSVIGSGPGVPDPTTWHDAAAALDRWGGVHHAADVRAHLAAGTAGSLADTPKPDNPGMARAHGHVIANRQAALDGACRVAEDLGYQVVVLPQAVDGEARVAATSWCSALHTLASRYAGPLCVVSAGETTVRVTGAGTGGRNQEFVLALAARLASLHREVTAASVGTDGIDGPTDAAGAVIDRTTLQRAAALGLGDPHDYLAENNSYEFFRRLGDLIHTGPTDTNVGDLQVALLP